MTGTEIGKSFIIFMIYVTIATIIGVYNDKLNKEYYENNTEIRQN